VEALFALGSSSKISDFKPLLGALYPDLLRRCAFWGYMQALSRDVAEIGDADEM